MPDLNAVLRSSDRQPGHLERDMPSIDLRAYDEAVDVLGGKSSGSVSQRTDLVACH